MPLSTFDLTKVEQFFSEVELFASAYAHPSIRYIAVRGKSGFILLHGALQLSAFLGPVTGKEFETADVFCEERDLGVLGPTPRAVVRALLSGTLEISGRCLSFPSEQSGNHSAHNWPFDGSQHDARNAEGQLTLLGANDAFTYVQQPGIFRQLKASPVSYNGLAELSADFGLKFDSGTNVHFDVYATRIVEFCEESSLDGIAQTIKIRLAAPLDPNLVVLAMRLEHRGDMTTRSTVAPDTIRWQRNERGDWEGLSEASVGDVVSVRCVLSYCGIVQHERSFTQPVHRTNILRFAFKLFDGDTDSLGRVIHNRKIKNRDGRELELTVAALLGMRGFALLPALDRIPKLEEMPDILASDKRGNLLVVECTLDLPNAENKLTKVSRKAKAIRQAFEHHGRNDVNVIAVLATSCPNAELRTYLDEARRQRILLWGQEDLDELRQDSGVPDADGFYDELLSATYAFDDLMNEFPVTTGDTTR